MIEWREEGLLLTQRRHGETSTIIEVLTETHGRHAGIVRGGTSRRIAPILQPGAQLDVTWKARLEDHLGSFSVEPVRSRSAALMGSRDTLAGLNAVTALLAFSLPEREAQPDLYTRTMALLDMMETSDLWPLAYLRWEMALLEELGFGLDLTECAATGATDELAYISPKTGRAVSEGAAGVWKDQLLPLSPAMLGKSGERADILAGLKSTGYFLTSQLAPSLGDKPLPAARQRLIDRLERAP